MDYQVSTLQISEAPTPKRKKDICNREQLQKTEKSLVPWQENETTITIKLPVGPCNSDELQCDCVDDLVSVSILGYQYWHAKLYRPVDPNKTDVSYLNNQLTIKLEKLVPEMWNQLEQSEEDANLAEQSQQPELTHCLDTVPHVFRNLDMETFELDVNIPNLSRDNVHVDFGQKHIGVCFKTKNKKFLKKYPQSGCNTVFEWQLLLESLISPAECSYVVTNAKIEMSIKKAGVDNKEYSEDHMHKEEQETYVLDCLRHDFTENNLDLFCVDIYVKSVVKETFRINFGTQDFRIYFSTTNTKFYESYPNADESTVFEWHVPLMGVIVPCECKYKVMNVKIEIKLKKAEQIKWEKLQALQEEICPRGMGDVPSNTWIPTAKNKANNVVHKSRSVPTTSVSPSKSEEKIFKPGLTGLDNLGNTCFMNAVIQCLANTRELRDYFLESRFQHDINSENPLGSKGYLAVQFALLLHCLWSGKMESYAPSKLKSIMAAKANQFVGHAQHDAQEFMSFLLDGLHEDLNRVKVKANTQPIECEKRSDKQLADDFWANYKLRDDSIIVDLFQGQFKSKLMCPTCGKVSTTFDPVLTLSVPLPKEERVIPIVFFRATPALRPVLYNFRVLSDGYVDQLFEQLSCKTGIKPVNIKIFEIHSGNINRCVIASKHISSLDVQEPLLAFEILEEEDEEVLLFVVSQRLLCPSQPTCCSFCNQNAGESPLKRCTKCYRAGYCNRTCQRKDWDRHKQSCNKTAPEPVGCPFLLNVPKSMATYSNLYKLMEAYSQYSMDVFQPPVASAAHKLGLSQVDSGVHSNICPTPTQPDDLSTDSTSSGVSSLPFDDSLSDKTSDEKVKEEKRDVPLFDIKVVSQRWSKLEKAILPDEGSEPLTFDSPRIYITMDWRNNDRLKGFCMAQSKQLDYDIDESTSHLLAAVEQQLTLDKCLQLFTETETLSSADAWHCPRCKENREAAKQISLWRLPVNLIIQLKRFSFQNFSWRDKIDQFVDFPMNGLDMSPYLGHNEGGSYLYDLYAVINHHGGILGGHYTAYARCADRSSTLKHEIGWRSFDDSCVEFFNGNVVTEDAYVLFYRKREQCSSPSKGEADALMMEQVVKEDINSNMT